MNDASHTTLWSPAAKWIGRPGACLSSWRGKVLPAPFFRCLFQLDAVPEQARLLICGLGYYELYINGRKVGNHVLDPVVTHYDRRVRYVVYDVAEYLQNGANAIGVILGNGWYNSHTPEVWHFDKASWRSYPKFRLQLNIGEEVVLTSDTRWKCTEGPILFDGLRNGETYDARLELSGWNTTGYNDTDWTHADQVNPPGGILQEQTMPPCRVMQTLSPVKKWEVAGGTVYDLGQNIAGWVRICVRGNSMDKVTLTYGERLDNNRAVDQTAIVQHTLVGQGEFQTDRYILKGEGLEEWEPRFTYHGFQYIQVTIEGRAEIEKLEGRVVYTSFDKIGSFECSDKTVNQLQRCTEWSYVGNFVGIPTDCPHREKNGWTGDAQLASETGLFNYAAASSYAHWIDSIVDAQRPSGQLPGIVPSCGWGYNWGSGPAWDSALILIPWYVYLYTGDDSIIRSHYEAMKRYVDYCTSMANDHIVAFGLGDWCHVDRARIVDRALTDTGYYYTDACLLAKFAGLTGRVEDQSFYIELAEQIRHAFNLRFYRGNGIYAKGEPTAMGCALYQGLVDDSEIPVTVQRLVEAVETNGCKSDFGILGAKYIPRVLADHGHVELAYRLITQPEYPGWVHWLKQGATTLWESWLVASSHNHIMFGDISAWFYQYLAGISPDPAAPGFKRFTVKPNPVGQLDSVKATHRLPQGEIVCEWQKDPTGFYLQVQIPPQTSAKIILPNGETTEADAGKHAFFAKG